MEIQRDEEENDYQPVNAWARSSEIRRHNSGWWQKAISVKKWDQVISQINQNKFQNRSLQESEKGSI